MTPRLQSIGVTELVSFRNGNLLTGFTRLSRDNTPALCILTNPQMYTTMHGTMMNSLCVCASESGCKLYNLAFSTKSNYNRSVVSVVRLSFRFLLLKYA